MGTNTKTVHELMCMVPKVGKVESVQAGQRVFSFCMPEKVSSKYIRVYTLSSQNFARSSVVLFIYASDRHNS